MSEYSKEMQKLFLEMMLSDPTSFVRVQNIYNSDNFQEGLTEAAEFVEEHFTGFGALPTTEQILAKTGVELKLVEDVLSNHGEWFMDEFETFTKRQELERAILKSAELLELGDFAPVENIIKDAVQISLTRDLGTNYFEDPKTRLLSIKENNGQISTGWKTLDEKLYGGFNKGELQVFAGGSGTGKSLFMQNLVIAWTQKKYNCVFVTLELSETLSSWRMDSMVTGTSTKDVFKELDDVDLKVRMVGKTSGVMMVKYLPSQSTVNDIRSYIREIEVQTNAKIDCVCVDYLDLLMPASVKVSATDAFVKDKYVSEELRNLAKELEVVMVTASQLNRSSVEEMEFNHSHIAGGISKINTADNVFAIYTNNNMRSQGKYQLQLIKTRSSSGVGQKVELEFNQNSLRITDEGAEVSMYASEQKTKEVMNHIKTNTPSITDALPEQAQKDKLSSMMGNMKK